MITNHEGRYSESKSKSKSKPTLSFIVWGLNIPRSLMTRCSRVEMTRFEPGSAGYEAAALRSVLSRHDVLTRVLPSKTNPYLGQKKQKIKGSGKSRVKYVECFL